METLQTRVKKPSFETVWAALQENAELMRKNEAEQAEMRKEADRRKQEMERFFKKLGRQMGDLHNKFGKLAEHLVVPGIARRFNELGFHFDVVAPGGHRILDEQGKIKTEVDVLLENGEYIIAVEVKTEPKIADIAHHIRRLEILQEHRHKRHDYRKIQGAIAGAIFDQDAKNATIEAGMYVLEQSGNTMQIEIPANFVPREW